MSKSFPGSQAVLPFPTSGWATLPEPHSGDEKSANASLLAPPSSEEEEEADELASNISAGDHALTVAEFSELGVQRKRKDAARGEANGKKGIVIKRPRLSNDTITRDGGSGTGQKDSSKPSSSFRLSNTFQSSSSKSNSVSHKFGSSASSRILTHKIMTSQPTTGTASSSTSAKKSVVPPNSMPPPSMKPQKDSRQTNEAKYLNRPSSHLPTKKEKAEKSSVPDEVIEIFDSDEEPPPSVKIEKGKEKAKELAEPIYVPDSDDEDAAKSVSTVRAPSNLSLKTALPGQSKRPVVAKPPSQSTSNHSIIDKPASTLRDTFEQVDRPSKRRSLPIPSHHKAASGSVPTFPSASMGEPGEGPARSNKLLPSPTIDIVEETAASTISAASAATASPKVRSAASGITSNKTSVFSSPTTSAQPQRREFLKPVSDTSDTMDVDSDREFTTARPPGRAPLAALPPIQLPETSSLHSACPSTSTPSSALSSSPGRLFFGIKQPSFRNSPESSEMSEVPSSSRRSQFAMKSPIRKKGRLGGSGREGSALGPRRTAAPTQARGDIDALSTETGVAEPEPWSSTGAARSGHGVDGRSSVPASASNSNSNSTVSSAGSTPVSDPTKRDLSRCARKSTGPGNNDHRRLSLAEVIAEASERNGDGNRKTQKHRKSAGSMGADGNLPSVPISSQPLKKLLQAGDEDSTPVIDETMPSPPPASPSPTLALSSGNPYSPHVSSEAPPSLTNTRRKSEPNMSEARFPSASISPKGFATVDQTRSVSLATTQPVIPTFSAPASSHNAEAGPSRLKSPAFVNVPSLASISVKNSAPTRAANGSSSSLGLSPESLEPALGQSQALQTNPSSEDDETMKDVEECDLLLQGLPISDAEMAPPDEEETVVVKRRLTRTITKVTAQSPTSDNEVVQSGRNSPVGRVTRSRFLRRSSSSDGLTGLFDQDSEATSPGQSGSPPTRDPVAPRKSYGGIPALTWASYRTDISNFEPVVNWSRNIHRDLHDSINGYSDRVKSDPYMRQLFESVIQVNTAHDEPDAPLIRILNDIDDVPNPPWEFLYTNDMYLADDVPPPDIKSLISCDCVGGCDPKSKTCACLTRQKSYTVAYDPNSDFAYDKNGKLKSPGFPIFECNARCSCGDECRNRVVQHGRKVQVDIKKTKEKGWGVFAGPKKIPEGTFIGIYSGELLTEAEANTRGKQYDKFGRTYLFDLDFHHLTEGNSKWSSKLTVDAYHVGNFTRFLNHSCDPNSRLYACYINEGNIQKPLLVIFSLKDIDPGEEICFSYNGVYPNDPEEDDEEEDDEDNKDDGDEPASQGVRLTLDAPCRCNAANCQGFMFKASK